jgi:hypothetical protein
MIQRVSKHTGYIEIVNERGETHSQVSRELRLLGWGPQSYAVQWGSTRHVNVYDENGRSVSTFYINPEYTDLHWDGANLTFHSGSMICTMDKNGVIVNQRTL